jgi:hypothetical protein
MTGGNDARRELTMSRAVVSETEYSCGHEIPYIGLLGVKYCGGV